jgi:hypothetical protein
LQAKPQRLQRAVEACAAAIGAEVVLGTVIVTTQIGPCRKRSTNRSLWRVIPARRTLP